MPSAYGISACLGWYRAGVGVYSDAGVTSANPGDGVYQWNDQSGAGNHLTQTTAANRPIYNTYAASLTSGGATTLTPFGVNLDTYSPAAAQRAILFDGSTSFLNIPAGVALTSAGCTVLLCSRGPYFSPISFGTDGTLTINYGWFGGGPQKMGIYNATTRTFPSSTYLPTLAPIVHGIRCSATLNESRLYMGTNQQSVINTNYCNFSMTGGAVGRTLNLSVGGFSNFSFAGEIYEIVIWSFALSDTQMKAVLGTMQTANGLRDDANKKQVIFIGDSLTAGGPGVPSMSHCYPWLLCQNYGFSFKPFLVAVPGQNISQQQTVVNNQIPGMDLSPFSVTAAVVCCGSNDIGQGRTDTQVVADLTSMCTGLRSLGIKTVIATITPRNAASGYTAGNITTLNSVNATIRSGFSTYADALADWAADARLQDPTDATYYASDQVHTNDAGDSVKAAIVRTAIDPLLNPPATQLAYATFYTPGRAYAGNYGNFLRS
jgi:lysophospholipase L1-like esterase